MADYDSLKDMAEHMDLEGGFFDMLQERWNGMSAVDLPADASAGFKQDWTLLQEGWAYFSQVTKRVEDQLWKAYEND